MARRMDHLDAQASRLDHVPVAEGLVNDPIQDLGGLLVGQNRHAEALGQLASVHDVVCVMMGEQQMRDLAALALGTLTERIGHAVRIDEHAMAADLVNDQIGV